MLLFAAINESEKRIQPLQLTLLCLAVIFFEHDKVDGRPIIQPENKHFHVRREICLRRRHFLCVSQWITALFPVDYLRLSIFAWFQHFWQFFSRVMENVLNPKWIFPLESPLIVHELLILVSSGHNADAPLQGLGCQSLKLPVNHLSSLPVIRSCNYQPAVSLESSSES